MRTPTLLTVLLAATLAACGGQVSRLCNRSTAVAMALAVFALTALSACSGDSTSQQSREATTATASRPAQTEPSTETEPAAGTSTMPPDNITADDYDPSIFDPTRSFIVDNPWFPLEPGTQYINRGWTEEDGERIPHSIVFTVTDLVKEVNGVRAVVSWDRDFSEGKLVEAELIFHAQDRAGNVWHFGQYSEVYDEEGVLDGASAWLVGALDGAKAGIVMQAEPRLGTPAYSEGFAPAPYFWDDWGKIYRTNEKTCVPLDCYEDVLVIDEFEPRKPGAHQLKFYARGVGNVRTGWRGSDPDREVLRLVQVRHLSADEMSKARQEALTLEDRAMVWGRMPPVEPRPSG
jgi:hypothetical protein